MSHTQGEGRPVDPGSDPYPGRQGREGSHGATACLLYTSDAADERSSVDLGGRRIIKKKILIEQLLYPDRTYDMYERHSDINYTTTTYKH